MLKDFFVNMLLLSEFSAIRLFFNYMIIWFIFEVMFYSIEKLLGFPRSYRLYDFVSTVILISMYIYNIQYLLDVLKSRL
jgi:hypothetical protein